MAFVNISILSIDFLKDIKLEEFDILSSLEDKGIKPELASQIVNHIKGNDYISLIDALQNDDNQELNSIISKFGVISESKLKYLDHTLDNQSLIQDGFKYYFEVDYNECDQIMDWLEENDIQYLTDGVGEFDVKADDEQAKKLIKMLSNKGNKMVESRMVPMGKIAPGMDPNIKRLRELAGFVGDDSVDELPAPEDDVITTIPDLDDDIEPSDDMDQDNSIDIVSDTLTPEQCSPAMNEINDYLNNIQNFIPDIKLSEYKTLVIKLQDLTTQLQSMAKGYLGERKLRK